MVFVALDTAAWASANFGGCELGDVRRTRRIVRVAEHVAKHPDGSTPVQTRSWAACKACYRLFDQSDVTFEGICKPHWQLTRGRQAGTCQHGLGWYYPGPDYQEI